MTTSQIVSDFRANYKLHSDDVVFTDRYIVSLANVARAKLLYQKASRDQLKRTSYVGFCLPLCIAKPLECPCIQEAQCYALVSKYDLPDYISSKEGVGLEVRTADGVTLEMISPRNAKLMTLNPALKNKLGYWLENYRGNTKVVIWRTLDLEFIYISMVPTDINDIANIAVCGDASVTTSCGDWTEEEFPIDPELLFDLYTLMSQLINTRNRTIDDKTNDTNDSLEE